MSPERLAAILGWNPIVMESEARREPGSLSARIMAAVREAEETEREACANVAASMNTFGEPPDVAAAIRARSQP